MNYIAALKNLESPPQATVETVENRSEGILDSLDSTRPGPFLKILSDPPLICPEDRAWMDAPKHASKEHDSTNRRRWLIVGEDAVVSVTAPGEMTREEIQAAYPGAEVEEESA